LPIVIKHSLTKCQVVDFRKEATDDYFDTDSPTNHLQPNTICDLFCHSNQLEYI